MGHMKRDKLYGKVFFSLDHAQEERVTIRGYLSFKFIDLKCVER
jgi:hypothetical protein